MQVGDRWSWWSAHDGPSLRGLHRAVGVGVAVVLVPNAVLCLAGVVAATTWPLRIEVLTICLVLTRTAVASARRVLGVAGVVVAAAAAAAIPFVPDATGSAAGYLSSATVSAISLAVLSVARPAVAVLVIGCLTASFVATQVGVAGTEARAVLANVGLNLTFTLAAAPFLVAMHRIHSRIDADATRAAEAETRLAVAGSRQRARATVERVLHDEIITALRIVAEERSSEPVVRMACASAREAVAGLLPERS